MRTMVTTLLVGLTLLTGAPQASAFGKHDGPGFSHGRGGPGGGPGGETRLPLRLLVQQMTPEQRGKVREILMADRGARHRRAAFGASHRSRWARSSYSP